MKNTLFGMSLVRIWAKIEKYTLCDRALVRVEIEKNILIGKALVIIRAK